MKRYLKTDEWNIIEDNFHADNLRMSESIFSLGNGRFGPGVVLGLGLGSLGQYDGHAQPENPGRFGVIVLLELDTVVHSLPVSPFLIKRV